MSLLEKLAQFQNFNDMQAFYDDMVERAYRLGISPNPNTNWLDFVEATRYMDEPQIREIMKRYQMSNNERQMANALNRITDGKGIEFGSLSLDPDKFREIRDAQQRRIDAGEVPSIRAGVKLPNSNFGGARAAYFNALNTQIPSITERLQADEREHNLRLQNLQNWLNKPSDDVFFGANSFNFPLVSALRKLDSQQKNVQQAEQGLQNAINQLRSERKIGDLKTWDEFLAQSPFLNPGEAPVLNPENPDVYAQELASYNRKLKQYETMKNSYSAYYEDMKNKWTQLEEDVAPLRTALSSSQKEFQTAKDNYSNLRNSLNVLPLGTSDDAIPEVDDLLKNRNFYENFYNSIRYQGKYGQEYLQNLDRNWDKIFTGSQYQPEDFPISPSMYIGEKTSIKYAPNEIGGDERFKYSNSRLHTHPRSLGRKYSGYLSYKALRDAHESGRINDRYPIFINGTHQERFTPMHQEYLKLLYQNRTFPSGEIKFKALQTKFKNEPHSFDNFLNFADELQSKTSKNILDADYGTTIDSLKDRRDVNRPAHSEKIYSPDSGQQSGYDINPKTGDVKHLLFMNEPQNRMSPEYKEYEKYYAPRQAKAQLAPRGSFKAFDSAAQKLSMPKKSWFLEKGFTKLAFNLSRTEV